MMMEALKRWQKLHFPSSLHFAYFNSGMLHWKKWWMKRWSGRRTRDDNFIDRLKIVCTNVKQKLSRRHWQKFNSLACPLRALNLLPLLEESLSTALIRLSLTTQGQNEVSRAEKIDRSINCKRLNRFSSLESFASPFWRFSSWCKLMFARKKHRKRKEQKLSITNWVTNKLLYQLLSHQVDTDPLHRIKLINFPPLLGQAEWAWKRKTERERVWGGAQTFSFLWCIGRKIQSAQTK